jgi:DNA primase large subunit
MAIRSAPAVTDRDLWAQYPFLPGAEALIAEYSPSLGELLASPAYGRARELGRIRVLAAADDPTGTAALGELDRADPDERFLSFMYARLILSVALTTAPARRWAAAEARRAADRLERVSERQPGEFTGVARLLGFPAEPTTVGYRFSLAEYLRLSIGLRDPEFRLVHQRLTHGEVEVSPARAARLLQEGIRVRLSASLPAEVGPDVRNQLEAAERDFLRDLAQRVPMPIQRRGVMVLRAEYFPPCIRKMRRMLEKGENLAHSGRFALAAFLHRVGADFDTIVDAYRGAPDFDEGISRYQIEHITQRDGGRGYEPPTCETLRSQGLCFRDGDPTAESPVDRARDPRCFDPNLVRPTQYYRLKGGAAVLGPAEGAGGSAASAAGRPKPAGPG